MVGPSHLKWLRKCFFNKLLLWVVCFIYCITVSRLLLSVFEARSTVIVGWSVLSGKVSWSNWPKGCIGQFGTFSVLVSSGFKSEFLFELDNRLLKCFFKFILLFLKIGKNTGKKFSLSNLNPIIEEQIIEVIIGYHHLDENRNPKKSRIKKKIENRLSRSSDHKLPLSGCLSHSNVHHIRLSYLFIFWKGFRG